MAATSDKRTNSINTKTEMLLAKEIAVLGPVQRKNAKIIKKDNRLKDSKKSKGGYFNLSEIVFLCCGNTKEAYPREMYIYVFLLFQ